MLFRAKVDRAEMLIDVFSAVCRISKTVVLTISRSKWHLQCMDPAHISLVSLDLHEDAFAEYSFSETGHQASLDDADSPRQPTAPRHSLPGKSTSGILLGLNLESLQKCLSLVRRGSPMSVSYCPVGMVKSLEQALLADFDEGPVGKMGLLFEFGKQAGGEKGKIWVPPFEYEPDLLGIPATQYSAAFSLTCGPFLSLLCRLEALSACVTVTAKASTAKTASSPSAAAESPRDPLGKPGPVSRADLELSVSGEGMVVASLLYSCGGAGAEEESEEQRETLLQSGAFFGDDRPPRLSLTLATQYVMRFVAGCAGFGESRLCKLYLSADSPIMIEMEIPPSVSKKGGRTSHLRFYLAPKLTMDS